MGMYDTVLVPCPTCGRRMDIQTKSGKCILQVFDLEDAPPDVLGDINRGAPYECQSCGQQFSVQVIVIARSVPGQVPEEESCKS